MSFKKLESFLFEKMSATRLPGVSAALIQGDDVAWSRGLGFRDLATGLPATPHTLYSIGSVTKSFTCLGVMQLAEQGRLSIDDPVAAHLAFDIRPSGEDVRIRHLMSHTSGIPALAYAESMIRGTTGAAQNWLPIASYEDVLTFMQDAQEWTVTRPGERWFYLNEGYQLLGYIIEKCAGISFQEYVRRQILAPLGMNRTFFDRQAVEDDQDAATPYLITRDGEHRPSSYPYGSICADGGIVSNVLDLARYVAMYLQGGASPQGRLLSQESVQAMATPRVKTPLLDGPFGDSEYAFGLHVLPDFLGHRLVGHSGSVGVATAYIGFLPEENLGVAVLANAGGYALSQMGQAALAVALGADLHDLPFVARERMLDELAGTYETYRGTTQVQVKHKGDFLVVESHDRFNDAETPLIPDRLETQLRTFHTFQSGARLPIEFRVHGEQIDLLFERYLFRRTGKLA